MNFEQVNSKIEKATKIISGIFGVCVFAFFIYLIYNSRPDIDAKKEACFTEKQIEFSGIVDSFFYDNTKGTVFIRLANQFTYTIPHPHQFGISLYSGDSILKKKGKNIYIIFKKYKSLGVDTANFECDCEMDSCLEAFH